MGKFKDLRVWQDSIDLAQHIYQLTREPLFAKDFGLSNQIQRASVSVASNIAEGDERGTSRESVHFFNIAKGSSAEVITQLHIAHRIGYIDVATLEQLESESEKIRGSLRKLIQSRSGSNPLNILFWPLITLFKPI